MHPDQRLRKAVKGFYAYVGSVLAAGAGPIVGMRLVHHDSAALRAVGVAVGFGGWIPLLMFTVAMIRASDEFTQRIHYIAASLAFAGGLLLVDALDWLVRAAFIESVSYMATWFGLIVLWILSLVVAKRRVERGPAASAQSS